MPSTSSAASNPTATSGTTPMPNAGQAEIWLIRHGETAWSKTGQHTGRTDIALTDHGREQAGKLTAALRDVRFTSVLCSPLQRARQTCALALEIDDVADPTAQKAGNTSANAPSRHPAMQTDADLQEWDYGIYEGRKTVDIRLSEPDWAVWDSSMPDGESLHDIAHRANRVVARLRERLLADAAALATIHGEPAVAADKYAIADAGDAPPAPPIALFSHGHFLRVLAACWIGDARLGQHLTLDTATVSILAFDRGTPVIHRWNARP